MLPDDGGQSSESKEPEHENPWKAGFDAQDQVHGALDGFNVLNNANGWTGGADSVVAALGGAALVQPELAPVAATAALAAAGNKETKDWNNPLTGKALWGNNADGSRRDSIQWVGHNTADAFHSDVNATTGT